MLINACGEMTQIIAKIRLDRVGHGIDVMLRLRKYDAEFGGCHKAWGTGSNGAAEEAFLWISLYCCVSRSQDLAVDGVRVVP